MLMSCIIHLLELVDLRRESFLEVNSYHSSATVSACAASNDWQLALSLLDSFPVTEVSAWAMWKAFESL